MICLIPAMLFGLAIVLCLFMCALSGQISQEEMNENQDNA